MLDDLYNPFMVILGIVYYCVNHITINDWSMVFRQYNTYNYD